MSEEEEIIYLREKLHNLEKDYENIEYACDKLQEQLNKKQKIIDKATNELFALKDMIYKPETREENFEIQRKISSLIKRLNGKEVEE
jgi:hypothetical protein